MAFECYFCGCSVWVTFDTAIKILNGKEKCMCAKCSRSRRWEV